MFISWFLKPLTIIYSVQSKRVAKVFAIGKLEKKNNERFTKNITLLFIDRKFLSLISDINGDGIKKNYVINSVDIINVSNCDKNFTNNLEKI